MAKYTYAQVDAMIRERIDALRSLGLRYSDPETTRSAEWLSPEAMEGLADEHYGCPGWGWLCLQAAELGPDDYYRLEDTYRLWDYEEWREESRTATNKFDG